MIILSGAGLAVLKKFGNTARKPPLMESLYSEIASSTQVK